MGVKGLEVTIMRRFLFGLVSLCGLVMVLGAGFLIIEKSIGQTTRDSTRAAIETRLDQIEESRTGGRAGRSLRRAVEAARALGRGMFYNTGIDLAAVLPDPAEGWAARAYDGADAERITGHGYKASALTQNATQSVLRRFEAARDGGKSALTRVFEGDGGLVAIRLGLSKKDLRELERASGDQVAGLLVPRPVDRAGTVVLIVDGVALREQPRTTETATGEIHVAQYSHLRFAVGRVADGEIISNLEPEQLLPLLRDLNMDAIVNALPIADDVRLALRMGDAAYNSGASRR